jgi:hypothetical protein
MRTVLVEGREYLLQCLAAYPPVLGTQWCLPEEAVPQTEATRELSATAGDVEGELDLSIFFRPVSDQLNLPACTANACADALEARTVIELVDKGLSLEQAIATTPDMSRMFLWWCGRNEMEPNASGNSKKGCYNRLIMDILSRHGVPNETSWPYDSDPTKRPSIQSFREAAVRRLSGYYHIDTEGDARHRAILAALRNKHTPVFGTSLSKDFATYKQGILPEPSPPYAGRHALVIVGWSEAIQAYKVRNSWSTYWGEQGYCWMSKGYILSPLTSGIWVITKGAL